MRPHLPSRVSGSTLMRALRSPDDVSLLRDLIAAVVVFGGIAFMAML